MTGKTRYIGFAFLAALLALTSCRDLALEPVFYALSQEVPLGDDKGFPDVASVFRMVKFNDAGTDYYLAAAGRLYIRGVLATDTWTVVAPPVDNAMCNTLELFGGTIYAGFYNTSSGAGYGLYTALPTLPITWTLAADADVQNVQISLIRSAGARLFVATYASPNVNALYFDNGANFDPVTGVPATSSVIDVESFGGSFWILSRKLAIQCCPSRPLRSVYRGRPGKAYLPAFRSPRIRRSVRHWRSPVPFGRQWPSVQHNRRHRLEQDGDCLPG